MRRARWSVIALVLAGVCSGPAWSAPPDYRLGPQDELHVRVYDLRAGTGQAYEWAAFSGTFTVGASGVLSLPLVGDLQAGDQTTTDLARDIAARLQAKVGLAEKPDASVEVIKYRPFYVMGSVDKPGEYEFRPGLTVLQAVSTAGGLARVTGDAMIGFERDALTSRGDLRVLSAARQDLLARQGRIDAELGNAKAITFAPDLIASQGDDHVARILREEQSLFDAHREDLQSQTDALLQSKQMLQNEIVALQAKDASLGHQLEINQRELEQVAGLVAKGLVVVPRQLELQRTTSQFETDRLDVQLAVLHAREDVSKTDRDALALKAKFRSDALQEAADVRSKLEEASQRLDTARGLVFHAEVRAPAALMENDAGLAAPSYFITRQIDGVTKTLPSEEGDPVRPGDVVRVEPQPLRLGPGRSTKTGEAGPMGPHPVTRF